VDNLTHSLIGALLGQAGLKRRTGLAMPALIIGGNIPDVDAACFFWLEGTEHLGFRRGITHGPPAMVLLPLLLAGLLWGYDRWQRQRGTRPEGRLPVNFKWLYLLSLIGTLSHPLFDWFNVYGIRLLEPFSSQWFYGDTLFIIDVWLWALLGFGVWFSLRREKQGGEWMRPARVVIAVMAAYIGLNSAITAMAERSFRGAVGDEPQLIASPVPFAFWERQGLAGGEYQWAELFWDYDHYHGKPLTENFCTWPTAAQLASGGSQAEAFLFWTRAPFAERAADGSVILRDARFYDPRARDRFAAPLPKVACLPLQD
jgi:inner membrane protein